MISATDSRASGGQRGLLLRKKTISDGSSAVAFPAGQGKLRQLYIAIRQIVLYFRGVFCPPLQSTAMREENAVLTNIEI
ncbi:hypothetical protein CWR45_04820 [Oceanobacillus chungangensis]|uniref:Uncharacterized protein n=1 Tax=Oceanobacillus chungangensis TaxID=1229152 RepID=A0A3D8PXQ8_9BACI|nr:hypothetical protein CWR45_04820 [Oceanobacillus chungangensis]